MRTQVTNPRGWRDLGPTPHGVVTRGQLISAGLSTSAVTRLIARGELLPLYRGVFLMSGHDESWKARLMGATLASSGHASHRAAAHLWGILDGRSQLEVTARHRLRDDSVIWHRNGLHPAETTILDGIPITGIHRTLIDLGDVSGRQLVEDALDRALEKRLTSTEWLHTQIAERGTQGRKGAALLKSILDQGHEKASWLERRFIRCLAKAKLPEYQREFSVGGYFVDFAWPELFLAVEVHGAKWHKNRRRWEKDLARHNELTARGWTILHFTWAQLRDDPQSVVGEIAATYALLARRLSHSDR